MGDEDRLFYRWDEVDRLKTQFWNKGLWWGLVIGFAFAWFMIVLIGLYLPQ